MGQSKQNTAKPKPNHKSKKTNNDNIYKIHVGISDAAFAFISVVLLALGGVLASDAQFRWPGSFIFFSGVISALCGAFIHVRHQILKMQKPALLVLLLFTFLITGFGSVGGSFWWFVATKDNDNFNVVSAKPVVIIPNENRVTRLSAVSDLNGDTVLHPIMVYLYMQIANNKATASKITGITLKSSVGPTWWPSWTKLCSVPLRGRDLIWLLDGATTVSIATDNVLTNTLTQDSVAPAGSLAGWTAWECPKGENCEGKYLRIGIADAAGTVSWQTISEQSIPPNLLQPDWHVLGGQRPIGSIRVVSSCP